MKRGIFNEKQVRALTEKESERILRDSRRSKMIQLECNHINADNGKDALKPNSNTTSRCKICKAEIITDPKLLNSSSVKDALEIVESAVAIIRHEVNISKSLDSDMVKATKVLHTLADVMAELEEEGKKKKEHKKNNHGNHNNNHGNKRTGFKRIKY